jgi:hypothetical protein
MSCERMESRIRAEVGKHLDACAVCRVRATEFSSVNDLLDELPMIEPSPAFDVRVRARIAAEPVKQSWWAWLRPSPRIAFASSVLLLAAMFVVYRGGEPPVVNLNVDDPTGMISDLPVMEDHDTLSNFEPLKELPPPVDTNSTDDDQQDM